MADRDYVDGFSEWVRSHMREIRWLPYLIPVGIGLYISQFRSFKRISSNAKIPLEYYSQNVRIPGRVMAITIDSGQPMIHFSHTPYLRALLWRNADMKKGHLKVRFGGIRIFPSPESLAYVRSLCLNKQVRIEFQNHNEDEASAVFMRWSLWHRRDLNLHFVEQGHATVRVGFDDWASFASKTEEPRYDALLKAERNARFWNRGYWKVKKKETKSELGWKHHLVNKYLERKNDPILEETKGSKKYLGKIIRWFIERRARWFDK